jgi:hypothetical protein
MEDVPGGGTQRETNTIRQIPDNFCEAGAITSMVTDLLVIDQEGSPC